MVGVYRVFRLTVSSAVLGIIVVLVGGFALDVAADHGIMAGLPDPDWNPLTIAESVPGFWPALFFATGLALGMGMDAAALRHGSGLRAAHRPVRRGPLDIVYDPNDHRFVHREFPHGRLKPVMHFKVGIHNAAGHPTLHDVVVSANRNAFVKAMVEPAWGAQTRHIKRIEPNATEFVEFLSLPDDPGSLPDGGDKVQRFVIRARAKDARGTSAKFEFSAQVHPMVRRLA